MKLRHYIVVSLVFGLLAELVCAFVGVLANVVGTDFLQATATYLHMPGTAILSASISTPMDSNHF